MKLFKNITSYLFLIVIALVGMSCEEDMDKVTLKEEISVNTLAGTSSDNYTFTFETRQEVFNEFTWDVPDFGFEASITYTLQMDTASGDFSSPVNLVTTQSTTASPTIGVVNNALLGMGLDPDVAAGIKFRVMSSVGAGVDPVYTNEVTTSITPYLAVFPPIYIIGDAQGWDLGAALEVSSTGPGTYEAIGMFQEAGKFRMFATPSWDAEQWGFSFFEGGSIPDIVVDGADGDSNFLFEGATGVYKITINLNTKTIVMEESELPTLFVIGDGQGWDLQRAASLAYMGGGKYEGTATLQKDGYFRLFEKADWNASQYGAGYFAEGSVPETFTAAGDGDDNFIFTGETAEYLVTVDLDDYTITSEIASAYPSALYLVGDDQEWTFANSPVFTDQGGGVFEATADFTNGATFRFFEEVDNWSDAYGYGYFETVDDDLGSVGDGDDNFVFNGTDGTYVITVSFSDNSVTIEPYSAYPPALYLVGDDQGWTFANSPAFTDMGNGVFEATDVTFTNGSTFRFFEEVDNWSDAYGAGYFTGGITGPLEATGDGDDNITFNGTDGSFKVTADFESKTLTIE
ncbi:SusE domain-containing protein [Marinoscillum sp.]|uniref:SusE domain-containing protein n=1 Tax=Marinoscillum sp. TaxID=2024838 RepID=UPI003BAB7657